MEYFWYLIASALAGIGTGLAGLSAATVMVPILIVLCPSFSGEFGAYQATAIALASDILGSAVTAGVYIRHKNIDLKKGWIMLVCIVSMCTLGSYAAYKVGNVVLGGFTLFLTLCIGIRFLVKPDSKNEEGAGTSGPLGWKGVLISLFFGLTIGFGTGFVGTGGGMMMLVVFTLFLGMGVKTAVGTSTFIMTFTALIASIAHILIHPAIVLEKWPVLLFCIVITTISSLISARFANKVPARTVGLTTGFVLTILGICMILLNYWDILTSWPIFLNLLDSVEDLFEYIGIAALILVIIFFLVKMPDFIFRKLLHLAAFTCIVYVIYQADVWQAATIAFLLFTVIVYPILKAAEHIKLYSKLFVEKKQGEVKSSLILCFGMSALVTSLCWGVFGYRDLAIAAVLMWGVGDGMASICGHLFGKHKVNFKKADHSKTWEGSAAMFISALLFGFLTLHFYGHTGIAASVLIVLPAAVIAAASELFSKNGLDTLIVPLSTAICLLLMQGMVSIF